MQLGIDSFVETTPDPVTGHTISSAERVRDLFEEIELADQVGLDVFGIGEHHREEFVASAPAVILAAAVARTKKIRLTSAVTVLSSDMESVTHSTGFSRPPTTRSIAPRRGAATASSSRDRNQKTYCG